MLQREKSLLLTRYEGKSKNKKELTGGGELQVARLKQSSESLQTGKPSLGKVGTLKICTGFFLVGQALSRELGQHLRRGRDTSRLPESLTEEVHPGESAPHTTGLSG